MAAPPRRRSAMPWLYALAGVLAVLSPIVFLGVWIAEGTLDGIVTAILATVADLVAALVAAVVATVLAAQRGITHVRTAVSGHPQGRAGRVAEFHAARWSVARERFAALAREYTAFEADPGAVAARPALADVSVPATARFVDAYADAQYLATDTEPAGPRREEFAAAVDRAVAAWHEAGRTADALAGTHESDAGHASADADARRSGAGDVRDAPQIDPTRVAGPSSGSGSGSEYRVAADAVRRAARRGVRDLRERLQA